MTPAILHAGVVRVVPAMGTAPECWIRVAPGIDPESVRYFAAAGFSDVPVITVPFAKAGDLSVDPATILAHGASRYLWVAGAAVDLLLSMFVALDLPLTLDAFRFVASPAIIPTLTVAVLARRHMPWSPYWPRSTRCAARRARSLRL